LRSIGRLMKADIPAARTHPRFAKIAQVLAERAETAAPEQLREAAFAMAQWCDSVEHDMGAATLYYRQAAELGHPMAQFSVGHLYFSGQIDAVRNLFMAVNWF